MVISLETERLDLIPFEKQEEDLFLAINTDPFVRKFLWDDEIIDASVVSDVLTQNESLFQEEKYGLWKIILKESGEIAGYTGLWFFFDEPQPQLLYVLLERFTGRGYAREASKRIVRYAFEVLGFEYLLAATDEPHLASQNVALSLGMKFDGKKTENGKPTLFYKIKNSVVN